MVTVIRKRLTPYLLSRLLETHSLINVTETTTPGEGHLADSKEILEVKDLDVILIDGCPPMKGSKLWLKPGIKLIVSTECLPRRRKVPLPDGWYFERIRVEHKLVGGVSDGTLTLSCWARFPMDDSASKLNQVPCQDLRSVMKTGVFGKEAQPLAPSSQVGEEALVVRPGVVSVGGLYPMLGKLPRAKIRTRFNDSKWCDRSPSLDELLLMWDVPETLTKCLPSEAKAELESSVRVPMRIMRSVCVLLAARLKQDEESHISVPSQSESKKRRNEDELEERRLLQKKPRLPSYERSSEGSGLIEKLVQEPEQTETKIEDENTPNLCTPLDDRKTKASKNDDA
jgi:hypothetical protein